MMIRVETAEQKRARLEQWHPKFAWVPTKIGNGVWVWLETVSRKAVYTNQLEAVADRDRDDSFMSIPGTKPSNTRDVWVFKHWSYRRRAGGGRDQA